jgi:hypothetical protein
MSVTNSRSSRLAIIPWSIGFIIYANLSGITFMTAQLFRIQVLGSIIVYKKKNPESRNYFPYRTFSFQTYNSK